MNVSRDEVRFAFAAVAAMRTAIVTRVMLPRLLPGSEDLRLWSEWGRKRESTRSVTSSPASDRRTISS